jgi:D-tyrosyl-tRNA(Tyr) deacylase
MLALYACSAYNYCMQYTIRGIPEALDAAIRERARVEGKSLNDVTVEVLADGLGYGKESVVYRDLSDIVGTWKKDAAVEAALEAQDVVDKSLWK